MKIVFSDSAWDDYLYWQSHGDGGKTLARVNELIRATRRDPFRGIGKPEGLRGDMSGWWSRRITDEHRLVYRVAGAKDAQQLEIAQVRYHY